MVVYARTDQQCRFQKMKVDVGLFGTDKAETFVDVYWLMDGDQFNFKKTNPKLKSGIFQELRFENVTPTSFDVLLPGFNKFKTDLKEARFQVEAIQNADGSCQDIKVFFTLGHESSNARIQVTSVYTEAEKGLSLLPTLISATIEGIDTATHQPRKIKYHARK